jgi:AraC-like DNA-binding protein
LSTGSAATPPDVISAPAGRLSVVEVAFLLGYESPSSFYRAFKRWTGETPSHFRRRAAR